MDLDVDELAELADLSLVATPEMLIQSCFQVSITLVVAHCSLQNNVLIKERIFSVESANFFKTFAVRPSRIARAK